MIQFALGLIITLFLWGFTGCSVLMATTIYVHYQMDETQKGEFIKWTAISVLLIVFICCLN